MTTSAVDSIDDKIKVYFGNRNIYREGGRVSGRTRNKNMKILIFLTRIGSVAVYPLLIAPSTSYISAVV